MPARWQRAAVVAAIVLGMHGWLLHAVMQQRPTERPRALAVELRQLPLVREVHVNAAAPAALTRAPRGAAAEPARVASKRVGAPQASPARVQQQPAVDGLQAPQTLPPLSHASIAADPPLPLVATAPANATPAPTRVPPSAELLFVLQQGSRSGQARMVWRSDGARYALALDATLPSGRELQQHSEGGFDAAGVAPLRLADRRRGRDVRAANFQREHGKVTFSGPSWELPLHAGMQDRASWLVQLVALAAGASDLRESSELAMWVVGARGAAGLWRFEVRGLQEVDLDGRSMPALWLVREPLHPYDVRLEVWLDPQRGHWPVQLRQTQIPGGEPLQWLLREVAVPAPGV